MRILVDFKIAAYAAPMTHLREKTSLDYPVSEIQSQLESYFASKRDADGVARFVLRAPMNLEHEVTIELRRVRDEENLNDVLSIAWTPKDEKLLPTFKGTLVTWGEDDPQISYVELEGDYQPPLGVPGEIFDEALGQQIAQTTAREFLADIKSDLEAGVERAR